MFVRSLAMPAEELLVSTIARIAQCSVALDVCAITRLSLLVACGDSMSEGLAGRRPLSAFCGVRPRAARTCSMLFLLLGGLSLGACGSSLNNEFALMQAQPKATDSTDLPPAAG